MFMIAFDGDDVDASSRPKMLSPFSAAKDNFGSSGILPKNGIFACSAKSFPPPLEKMSVHSSQFGHT